MASSSRLKPGESGRIRVTVDLRGKTGNLMKTVHVYTNDPGKPVVNLSVMAKVVQGAAVKKWPAER